MVGLWGFEVASYCEAVLIECVIGQPRPNIAAPCDEGHSFWPSNYPAQVSSHGDSRASSYWQANKQRQFEHSLDLQMKRHRFPCLEGGARIG
jgi:hypothetical protein